MLQDDAGDSAGDNAQQQGTSSALLLSIARFMLEAQESDGALAEQVFDRVKGHVDAQIMFTHRAGIGGALRMVASRGISDDLREAAIEQRHAQVLCKVVAQSREPLVTGDARTVRIDDEPAARFIDQVRLRAYACHPLLSRDGAVLGTLAVGRDRVAPFTSAEVEFMQTVSHLLALAYDRRRVQEDLEWRERQLQTLVDHTPCILARYDRQQRCVFVNAHFEQVTGLKPEQVLGRDICAPDVPQDVCARLREALSQVFEHASPVAIAFQTTKPDGVRYFESEIVPELSVDGTVEFALALTRDRTGEERARRVLQEAAQQKDAFLATLAHELRNPLAPIRTGLQILRLLLKDRPETGKTLSMLERQVRHMVRLIDDLLDVSRISRGKIALQIERVSLREVIDHAIESSRPNIDACRHHLRLHLPHEVLYVNADSTRLAQVLSNLLNNAAKYTPDGGQIDLYVERQDGQAVIRVTDNGTGIDAQALPDVFEMFTQAGKTLHRAQGGLGIGLSIVKTLVQMHGGTVEAHSAGAGQGSQFTVRLPLAPEPPSAPAGVPVRSAPVLSRRVLVVHHNHDSAESLATMLKVLGHDSRCVHSRSEALEQVRDFSPELVFCSTALPGESAFELARELRGGAASGAVLVALTEPATDRRTVLDGGFDLALNEPVELDALQNVMIERRRRAARR